ncbi:hypothetical protein [Pseudonocardia sp.]|uniref:hypothetical protein n=1 Tax=Pseudonocardia sp. TaxID=60912 RepID=UPI0026282A93|nr:hypothetical protein [Pseudonocardia sp.]
MAQLLSDRDASPGVVTVADLLSRYASEPPADPAPATAPVSVHSLLRREGRAPQAAEPPVPAGSDRQPGLPDDERAAPVRRGTALRRSALAAGVLLAAGSVFGAGTVLQNSATPAGDAPAQQGGLPGQGRPGPEQVPAGAVPTVVDNTAQSDALDPGAAAPTSWMATAFPDSPGGAGDGPSGSAVPGTSPPAGSGTPQGSAAPLAGGADDRRDSGDQRPVEQDSGSGRDDQSGNDQSGNDQGGGSATEEQAGGGIVGGTVETVGGALPDPLSDPVRSLGRTVSGLL